MQDSDGRGFSVIEDNDEGIDVWIVMSLVEEDSVSVLTPVPLTTGGAVTVTVLGGPDAVTVKVLQ